MLPPSISPLCCQRQETSQSGPLLWYNMAGSMGFYEQQIWWGESIKGAWDQEDQVSVAMNSGLFSEKVGELWNGKGLRNWTDPNTTFSLISTVSVFISFTSISCFRWQTPQGKNHLFLLHISHQTVICDQDQIQILCCEGKTIIPPKCQYWSQQTGTTNFPSKIEYIP